MVGKQNRRKEAPAQSRKRPGLGLAAVLPKKRRAPQRTRGEATDRRVGGRRDVAQPNETSETHEPDTVASREKIEPDAVVDNLIGELRALAEGNSNPDDSDMEELAGALADAKAAEDLYASDDDDDDVDGADDGTSRLEDSEVEDETEDDARNSSRDSLVGEDGEDVDVEADSDNFDDELEHEVAGSNCRLVNANEAKDEPNHFKATKNRRGLNTTGSSPTVVTDDVHEDKFDRTGTHKKDLKSLKTSDPSFYEYLAENDAGLLDFIGGEHADDSDESNSDAKEGSDAVSDSAEDGDDADSAEDEAAAAAEAGLADMDAIVSDDSDQLENADAGHRTDRKPVVRSRVVDMSTIRELEEQLALKRGALKAVKELMRMFRAGRCLTTPAQAGAQSKADKTGSKKRRKEQSGGEDWFAAAAGEKGGDADDSDDDDDNSDEDDKFVAGELKFVSARVYQKVMYLAIVKVQETLDKMLGKPKHRKSALTARWTPGEHARWKNLEPIVKSYVSQLFAMASAMQDAQTLRFLLKRLELLVPYTRGNVRLARRLTKLAVSVWTSDTMDVNEATKLRAYLLLRCIADEPDNVEVVLRLVVKTYCGRISRACNPRTLPNILFAAKCIVDLFGVDMAASYTVAFAYLREMAVTLRVVLTAKERNEQADKVHNWSFVNALRLWSMVLSTYGAESELRPLIYPYVQIALGVMRVQPTPRTFPMRLHIASYLTNVVGATGIYIPVAAQVLPLLRCKELYRKPAAGTTKDLEWRALLRVGDEAIKTKPYLTGVVNGVMLQLSAFHAAISRHVSFPEISHGTIVALRKFSKSVKEAEWRSLSLSLADKLRDTAKLVADARARADFGPHGAVGERGMLETVPGLEGESVRTPVQKFYDVEITRVKHEEALRDENMAQKESLAKMTVRDQDSDDDDMSDSSSLSQEAMDCVDKGRDSSRVRLPLKREPGSKGGQQKPVKEKKTELPLFKYTPGPAAVSGEVSQSDDSDVVNDLVISSDEE
jgi:nucleolar complex protein 2